MSNNVRIDISGNNEKLQSSLKDSESLIGSFGKGVTTVFAAVAAAAGALYVGKKLFDWGSAFVDAAAESQEAEAKLNAVLKATANSAGFTTEQLVAMSEQLQETTKFEAETTQGAQALLASFRNVRGDIFKDAIAAAQDMSTVLGTDLNGSALQLGKALNDPLQGITALKRAGVSFTDAQEDMINTLIKTGDVMGAQRIILEEVKNEFGGAAEEVGRSFTGRMEQMKNRFGDIAESLGAAIMPIVEELMPMVEGFAAFCENIIVPIVGEVINKMIDWGKAIGEYLRPAFDWLVEVATVAFSVIETLLENFGAYWNLTINTIALTMVKFVDSIRYWFTEVMPAYIQWFVDNFGKLMEDAANFELTVLQNMGKNIADFVKGVVSWMKGDGFDFTMTGLLEGFESTLGALPDIAERSKTGLEKALEADIARDAIKIGSAYAENLRKNREAMAGAFDKAEKKPVDMYSTEDKNFNPDDFTTKKDEKEKKKKDKDDKEEKKKGDTEGLEDLNKRISAAAMKDNDKERMKELKKELENLIENNKGLVDAVKKGADAAMALFKANDTLEKTMQNVGKTIAGGADKAVEGAGALIEKAGNAIGIDVGNLLGGFGGLVDAVGTNIEDMADAMDEQSTTPTDEEMLDELRVNTRNQTALLDTLGQLLGVNKQQLGAAEETVDLLPSIGGLK